MKKIIFSLLLLPVLLFANDAPVQFDNSAHEKLYDDLIEEIRCLVCQNQSLADSNAPLAQDLREEIVSMIKEDHGNDEIKSFLISRYGDFVLYRPPLQSNTWILWAGPFMFLILGIIIAVFLIRKQTNHSDQPSDTNL